MLVCYCHYLDIKTCKEEFEDTKGVIRIHILCNYDSEIYSKYFLFATFQARLN